MIELSKRHYNAIVDRGLIDKNTTFKQFMDKLDEEIFELKNSNTDKEVYHEAMDCICVLTNMLLHYNVDIKAQLIKNIELQEKRAKG